MELSLSRVFIYWDWKTISIATLYLTSLTWILRVFWNNYNFLSWRREINTEQGTESWLALLWNVTNRLHYLCVWFNQIFPFSCAQLFDRQLIRLVSSVLFCIRLLSVTPNPVFPSKKLFCYTLWWFHKQNCQLRCWTIWVVEMRRKMKKMPNTPKHFTKSATIQLNTNDILPQNVRTWESKCFSQYMYELGYTKRKFSEL